MISKHKIRLTINFVSTLLLCVAVFVIADYFALFGTSKRVELDFVEARFRTIEKNTGALIFGAGVRCFQKKNNNACTRRDSHQAGVVSVNVPFKRIIESSFLFIQNETFEKPADPKIHMMFIHNSHMKATKTLLLEEMFANPGKEYQVEMTALNPGDSGEQES